MDDYGQCDRACRVSYGEGWNDRRFFGRRGKVFGDYEECDCYGAEDSHHIGKTHRLFPKEDAGYPYIETGEAGVCGDDMKFYENAESAKKEGVKIVNCGMCGVCSTRRNVGAYHNMSKVRLFRSARFFVAVSKSQKSSPS